MKPTYGRAIAGGFVGTAIMTVMMYFVAPMMLGQPMDIAAMLSRFAAGSWMGGMILHFLNGTVLFPLVYAAVLYPYLPGSPAVKGTAWGVALWLVAQVVVMPMMGGGVFSANVGGLMAAMASLMGHVLYGAALGSIASSPEATAKSSLAVQH